MWFTKKGMVIIMANIREVAREAGVSIATASRILSGDNAFKSTEFTKQKIYDAVNKLGYVHHPKKKFNTRINIGCILPLTSEKYSDPFFTSILSSIDEELNQHNTVISAIRNYNELQDPKILNELLDMKLQGIIIMESLPKDILDIISSHIPCIVMIDQQDPRFNTVGFDLLQANMQIMDHLIGNGYKRIAYIGGSSPNISVPDSIRFISYREALRKNKIAYDESIILDCNWDLNLCSEYTKMLLSMDNRPDAIFAGSDTLASVILGVIYQMGLTCPKDIGVVGFNNLDTSAHTIPPLTTVEIPTKDIGKVAAKRLLKLIKNTDKLMLKILLPTKLIVRNSTRNLIL